MPAGCGRPADWRRHRSGNSRQRHYAAYETVQKFLHSQPIGYLGIVIAASVLSFSSNEIVAVFRIKVVKEIESAALTASGQHIPCLCDAMIHVDPTEEASEEFHGIFEESREHEPVHSH